MTLIGTLVTKFTANLDDLKAGIAQYGRELKEAEKKNEDYNRGLNAIITTISGIIAGITAAIFILKQLTDAAVQFGDAMKKASYATGLSVDELQRWKAAGLATDVTFEELANVARMMTSRLDELNDPTSEASKNLAAIGVSAFDVNGKMKSTNDIMWETIKALHNLPPGIERNSAAMKIFGRNWYVLAPLIEDVTKAQEAFVNADVISDERIDKMDEMEDSLNRISATMGKWAVIMGEKLFPLLDLLVSYTDKIDKPFQMMAIGWDKAQYEIGKDILYLQSLVTGNWDKYNAYIEANKQNERDRNARMSELLDPRIAATKGASTGGAPGIPVDTTAAEALQKKAEENQKELTRLTEDYADAIEKAADAKQGLVDLDKDYERQMSQVGWDVGRARELTIQHGWAEEDQAKRVGEAQAEVSRIGATKIEKGAVVKEEGLKIGGDLVLNIPGYTGTLESAVEEGKRMAKERIKAGVT